MSVNKRLKHIYANMKDRCYNPKSESYQHYGGRSIKICKEWLNSYGSFEKWALANGYKDNLSIDRTDVNGNYEPTNCRWVGSKVQGNNKRHYWLPESQKEFIYTQEPTAEEQRVKREEIKTRLSSYHLTQVWLIHQLSLRGLQTDKTEMCSLLAGTRVGAKSEYILNMSLEILQTYHEYLTKLEVD